MNGRIERFHLSLKREAFENVVPINLSHKIKICRSYLYYNNKSRPHQGINGEIPSKIKQGKPENRMPFRKIKHLSGKIPSFGSVIAVAA